MKPHDRATRSPRYRRPLVALALAGGLALVLWPVRALRSETFVFYLATGHRVVPVRLIEGARFLPLLPVLNVIGTVSNTQQKRNSLKLQIETAEMEFRVGDNKVRINKEQMKLSTSVRVANGEWLVPLDFVYTVLPRLTRQTLQYRVGDKRMFVGDLRPATFSVRLDPISNGVRLSLQFTGKVGVQTAARNGKWIIYLRDQTVQPLEQMYHFQSPYVSDLQFDDQDGIPKLILTPVSGGLDFYPKVSNEGQVLTADVVNPAPPVVAQQPPAAPPQAPAVPPAQAGGGTALPQPAAAPPAPPPQPILPAVVLDAGHGGSDLGARSRDGINEKDLTAQLVERARQAVLSTGKYRVVLTRAGDANPTLDQRDLEANTAQPAAFVTFHAGNTGSLSPSVAVYTYPAAPPPPVLEGTVSPLFVPWQAAQQRHLGRSEKLAEALGKQLGQIPDLARSGAFSAPVRQLRSVDAPAIAVEVGTFSPMADAAGLANPDFQQHIADALAQVLAAWGAS